MSFAWDQAGSGGPSLAEEAAGQISEESGDPWVYNRTPVVRALRIFLSRQPLGQVTSAS